MGATGIIGTTSQSNCDVGSSLIGRVGTVGQVNYVTQSCWAADNVIVATPKGIDSRYAYFLLSGIHLPGLASSTAQPLLTAAAIGSVRVDVPTLEEQRRIAAFLDAEISRWDELARVRTGHWAALDEYEMASIADTLSGSATMSNGRPTGWQWLPVVPADWRIGPVYAYFEAQLGKMLNSDRAAGFDQAPYLRNANVHWYQLDCSDMATMSFPPEERYRYRVEPGDLLVCEGGAGVAEAAVWDGRVEPCYFQKSLHRVRRNADVPVEWLMYWLRLAKYCGVFEADGNVATIPHLTGEQLRRYRIPIPPDGERRVARLSREVEQLSELRGRIAQADALTAERKQALIVAAVTGQFDVTTGRGADLS
ncbi:hypothetical protein GCM10009682_18050 [Luedemannella flava]|uniref:Type I restriction modification DNA specificity domain-containing protein n=2 Tax=Luedemannella flava TaxID=349316 RepID=A0ABP4XZV9_9ACTN